jgi:hypothetical protein
MSKREMVREFQLNRKNVGTFISILTDHTSQAAKYLVEMKIKNPKSLSYWLDLGSLTANTDVYLDHYQPSNVPTVGPQSFLIYLFIIRYTYRLQSVHDKIL